MKTLKSAIICVIASLNKLFIQSVFPYKVPELSFAFVYSKESKGKFLLDFNFRPCNLFRFFCP